MGRSRSFTARVLVIALAVLLASAQASFASAPGISSVSIQEKQVKPTGKVWPFNEVRPTARFNAEGTTAGFLYMLDRQPDSIPEFVPPPGVPRSSYAPVEWSEGGGSSAEPMATPILDMRGWLALQTLPYSEPGMSDLVEGQWWIHVRSVVSTRGDVPVEDTLGDTYHARFLIDITPPRPVEDLRTMEGVTWYANTHVDVVWDNPAFTGDDYDSLTGDSRWSVSLNGKKVRDFSNYFHNAFGMATIEDLQPGTNTIGVSAIDYAGNVSEERVINVGCDPDVPTVSITSPKGDLVGAKAVFSADAKDQGGVRSVKFYLDGKLIGTDTNAPYELSYSLASYTGKHTLKAVAEDMLGRKAEDSKSFTVDRQAPSITSVSDTPDPFYPFLTDGYKDFMYAKFKLSEDAKCALTIYDSSGKTIRTVKGSRKAGSVSLKWDGKDSDGTVSTGTFYYRIRATDAAGNSTSTSKYATHIRNYEIVRISDDAVKVVPR